MKALTVNRIFISLILGIVVWVICRYFLYWVPGGRLISLLLSIVGAILFTVVADFVAASMKTEVSLLAHPLIAAVGSGTVLFLTTLTLTVSNPVIKINCTPASASASPDSVLTERGATVKWIAANTSSMSYTIRFKYNSPFDDPSTSTQQKDIPSDPTTGGTAPNTVKSKGRFGYGFTCSNGTVVDPMIDVWR